MRRTIAYLAVPFLASALVLVLAALGSPAAAQTGKPWRHALIQPKSDAGILLMPNYGGFYKKVGLDVGILNVKDDEIEAPPDSKPQGGPLNYTGS